MEPSRQAPSTWRIIVTDLPTLAVSLFAFSAWFLCGVLAVWGLAAAGRGVDPGRTREGALLGAQTAVLATLFALIFVVLRVRWFRALYSRGMVVPGTIVSAHFSSRGHGHVTYRYTYLGETYKRWRSVMLVPWTRGLKPGTQVPVVVDPEDPKQAVIRDIYA